MDQVLCSGLQPQAGRRAGRARIPQHAATLMVEDVGEPFGGYLVLRHAGFRKSGTWGPDDYDVIDSRGREIGRTFRRVGDTRMVGMQNCQRTLACRGTDAASM